MAPASVARFKTCFNPFQGNYCFETGVACCRSSHDSVSIPSRATTALRPTMRLMALPISTVSIPSRAATALRRCIWADAAGSYQCFNPFQGNYCFETRECTADAGNRGFNPFQGNYCFETPSRAAMARDQSCFNPFQGNYCFETLRHRLLDAVKLGFNPFQGNYCFETSLYARGQLNPFQGSYCFETSRMAT